MTRAVDEERGATTRPDAIARRLDDLPRVRQSPWSSATARSREARAAPRRALDRRGLERDRGASTCSSRARRRDHPQERRPRSSGSRAPATLVAETIAHVGERHRAGHHDRSSSTGSPTRSSADRGGSPDLAGVPGTIRRAICISAERRSSCTGSPDGTVVEDGDLDHDRRRRRRSTDRSPTAPTPSASASIDRRVAAAARRLPGRARGAGSLRRGSATGSADISHADPADRRGGGLLRRHEPRRARRRAPLPRGPARPELRRAGPGAEALRGHDDRDRADDHDGRPEV